MLTLAMAGDIWHGSKEELLLLQRGKDRGPDRTRQKERTQSRGHLRLRKQQRDEAASGESTLVAWQYPPSDLGGEMGTRTEAIEEEAELKAAGYEVDLQYAQQRDDPQTQVSQVENLLISKRQ